MLYIDISNIKNDFPDLDGPCISLTPATIVPP